MQIKIPRVVASSWDAFVDWGDVPVWRGIRRVDVCIAMGFVFCVGWYGAQYGLQGAVTGGVTFLILLMTSLVLRP